MSNKIINDSLKYGIKTSSLPVFSSGTLATTGINGVKYIAGSNPWLILGKTNAQTVVGGLCFGNPYGSTYFTLDMGRLVLPIHFNYNNGGSYAAHWAAALMSITASQDNSTYTTIYAGNNTITTADATLNGSTLYRYYTIVLQHPSGCTGSYNTAAGAFNLNYLIF